MMSTLAKKFVIAAAFAGIGLAGAASASADTVEAAVGDSRSMVGAHPPSWDDHWDNWFGGHSVDWDDDDRYVGLDDDWYDDDWDDWYDDDWDDD